MKRSDWISGSYVYFGIVDLEGVNVVVILLNLVWKFIVRFSVQADQHSGTHHAQHQRQK